MRAVIAVIIAGLVATLVDNFAAWRLFRADFEEISTTYGRYVVAVGGAALLPFIFSLCGRLLGVLVAFVILSGAPAILATAAFGKIAPPLEIYISTSIYAVVAIFVYLSVVSHQSGRLEKSADGAEDR